MNLRVILILFGILAAMVPSARASQAPQLGQAASPIASPAPDPCVDDSGHSALLAVLNRPTIGFAACALKPKEVVAEIGYANATGRGSAANHDVTYPQTFLRYGLRPNLEIDFVGPALESVRSGGSRISGFDDSGVGVKFEPYHDANTVIGFDGIITVASGTSTLSLGSPSYTLNFDLSRQITSHFAIAATVGGASLGGPAPSGALSRYWTWLPSVVATELVGNKSQLYLEEYGATRIAPGASRLGRYATDGGIQTLLTPHLELDLEAGRSVTDTGRTHYYGFGFGVYW